jgi:hypothetical protein
VALEAGQSGYFTAGSPIERLPYVKDGARKREPSGVHRKTLDSRLRGNDDIGDRASRTFATVDKV